MKNNKSSYFKDWTTKKLKAYQKKKNNPHNAIGIDLELINRGIKTKSFWLQYYDTDSNRENMTKPTPKYSKYKFIKDKN